jgi:ankyrin repeat protein
MRNIIIVMSVVIACAGLFWVETAESADPTIYEAQKKLEDLGYDPGKADGIRGRKTVTAIKLFQEDSGLPATGRLDANTKTRLRAQRVPSQFTLNEAVRLNDIVLVEALIDVDTDFSEGDELGETPLHDAAVRGYGEIALLLIEKGADVNARDVRGLTPVHAAAWRGHREMVALLAAKGADIHARDQEGLTPLHTAALAGRKETVDMLIAQGAEINAKNKNDLTPLHAAALSGDRETVALLMDKGADVNVRSKDGLTPLQMASQQHHQDVVELLRRSQTQD